MSDHHPNDSFDELMRRALAEEADLIEPADALPEIQARAHAQRRPTARRPWAATVGAAALGTAAAIGAFTVLDDNGMQATDDQVAGAGTTTTATGVPKSAAPSPVPTAATLPPTIATVAPTERGKPEPVVKGTLVPVYWLGDKVGAKTKSTVRLYRTWAKVEGRPAVEAVRIMTSSQPSDPDYYSVWRGAQVNSVTRSNGLVTVDFNQLPKARLDAEVADVAAQQLVYTVQGALGDDSGRIRITQQGRVGARLFGQIDTTNPLARDKAENVQALIWVTSPGNGVTLTPPFKVSGVGSAFEAQLNWRVVDDKTGRVVAQGPTSTTEAFKFTPFSFIVKKLPPGAYTLEVFESSAEDGRATSTDTKTFVVR